MNRKIKPPRNDLTGQKFGFLKVLRMEQTDKSIGGSYRAICLCDCGKEHETAAQSLMRGRTKSCGCDKSRYEKTRGKNNSQFKGHEEIGGKLWGNIKTKARRRNLDFNLDIKDAWKLFLRQERKCAFSGLPLVFGISNGKPSDTTASLDRIDNDEGYTIDNVQWVHKTVNIMRNVLRCNVFVAMCRKIAGHSKGKMDDDALSRNMFGKGT